MSNWSVPGDGREPGAPARSRRRLLAVVSAAVAAVVVGGVASAVAMTGHGHGPGAGAGLAPALIADTAAYAAVADVIPPVAAGGCGRADAFSFSGTLSATTPGTVSYRWVYSSGQRGPVQEVRFRRPGHLVVGGHTVGLRSAGRGWAELVLTAPVHRVSNKAAFRRLCGGGSAAGISAAASVSPAARTAGCAPAAPAFTARGMIRAARAGRVTYYWARSNGHDSAPAALTFRHGGAETVAPLAIAPPPASGTGAVVLVVTSPVTVASRAASYTLTCKAPAAPAAGSSPAAPAGTTPGAPTSPTGPASGPSSSPGPSTSPSGAPSAGAGDGSAPPSSGPAGPAPGLTVDDSLMSWGTSVGQPYDSTATVSGGTAPYHWGATGLPPGVTATPDGSRLTVSGTPGTPGTYTVTMSATDSSAPARSGSARLTLYITLTAIRASVDAPGGVLGQPYSATITATGGDGNYTWDAHVLPPGLAATAHGSVLTVSGTPAADGQWPVSATLSDGESPPQTWQLYVDLTFTAPPVVVSGSIPAGTVGQPYQATLSVSGGTGGPWTWVPQHLPPGLTATAAGATLSISGTPAQSGSYQFRVDVNDQAHNGYQGYAFVINPG